MKQAGNAISFEEWSDRFGAPKQITDITPIAARFVLALRLIALHERAKSDPVPELAVRLGCVGVASRALAFAQVIGATWPDNIHVSRYCCQRLTHDEATIGAVVDGAAMRDRTAFERAVEGLIRHDRIHRLWDAALSLIAAEAHAT